MQHKQRLSVTALCVPLIIATSFYAPCLLKLAYMLLLRVAIGEACRALEYDQRTENGLSLAFSVTALSGNMLLVDFYRVLPALVVCYYLFLHYDTLEKFAMMMLLYMWLAWMPCHLLLLFRYADAALYGLYFVCTVYFTDAAAFYGGHYFGKTTFPLLKKLSPSKTTEGVLAGFVGGSMLFVWMASVAPTYYPFVGIAPQLPSDAAILLGATVSCYAIVGDLLESAFKRHTKIKDSGSLFPGHGGALDRLDSLLIAAPVYYYLLQRRLEAGQ